MEETCFQKRIVTLLPNITLKFWEPMAKHTSFRIGGPAEVMAFPRTPDEIAELIDVSKMLDCKMHIIGAGTNILAPDQGLQGLVICLKDCLSGMKQLDDTHIWVAAGVTMSRAAVFASGLNLGGMEFAHGIPGSVGGGVYMNAGAYGGEMSQIVKSVDVMLPDGTQTVWTKEDMHFSYRHSRMEEEQGIVLGATLELVSRPQQEVKEKMADLMGKRKNSQPLDKPSAGSAFKRPVAGYAAAMIDEAGLKGFQVGDAAVSSKHAGFVVNLGHATAEDVKTLLQEVANRVQKFNGTRLEPEVRIW